MRLMVNATSYGEPAGGAAIRSRELCGALPDTYELLYLLAEDTPAWVVPPRAASLRLPVRASQPLRRWRRLRIPEEGDALLTDHYPAATVPTFITLHDRGGGALRRRTIRRHLQRAAGVVAVSATVRDAWGVDAEIVPNGVHPVPARTPREHLLLCDPGLAHKGAETARATARALGRPLREVGRGVRWLDRGEMASELAQAAVVLCPSRDEGFGMVALEAMAAGRPVVVSDLPAHREVCGDAVFYAAPGDRRAWEAATVHALEFAHKTMPLAIERAARFSWAAAAATLDAFIRRQLRS